MNPLILELSSDEGSGSDVESGSLAASPVSTPGGD